MRDDIIARVPLPKKAIILAPSLYSKWLAPIQTFYLSHGSVKLRHLYRKGSVIVSRIFVRIRVSCTYCGSIFMYANFDSTNGGAKYSTYVRDGSWKLYTIVRNSILFTSYIVRLIILSNTVNVPFSLWSRLYEFVVNTIEFWQLNSVDVPPPRTFMQIPMTCSWARIRVQT